MLVVKMLRCLFASGLCRRLPAEHSPSHAGGGVRGSCLATEDSPMVVKIN